MQLALILVGFGNVARRFVRLLDERAERLHVDHDLTWRVIGIATRRHGAASALDGVDVARALDLVEAGGSLEALAAQPGTRIRADATVRHEPVPSCRPEAESSRTSVPLVPDSGVRRNDETTEADAGGSTAFIRRTVEDAQRRDPARPVVMVETTVLDIERGQPAIDHVRTAIQCGAHVISANKGPVAFAAQQLLGLAARCRRAFLFEGAVMDGIPVFNLVRETLPAVSVTGFRGVINSTTNYIITAMEEGREFGTALAEMQKDGIAEADASFDVDGWDAAAKTAALINVLMGGSVTPHAIERTGIGALTGAAVRDALARGRRVKLVASACLRDGRPVGRVAPEELPAADLLATLARQQNALVLQTDLLGEVGIVERGSGLTTTAYALLSDLVEVRRRL
jgi:homoserine dehydrogenase